MKRWIVLLFVFIILLSPVVSFEWPVEEVVLTATFGENRWGHFHDGIDLGGGAQEIKPIENGEIIYYFEETERLGVLPSGLGSFAVIDHQTGFMSLYAHIEPGTIEKEKTRVTREDPIGVIGASGGSYGKHLHLTVFDTESDQIINPLLILPSRGDGVKPRIYGVYLQRQNPPAGEWISVGDGVAVEAGEYRILLDSQDKYEDAPYYMAPFRFQVYQNGEEVVHTTMEALRIENGYQVLYQSDGMRYGECYIGTGSDEEWVAAVGTINLASGENSLEIIVQDFFGNETSFFASVTAE